METRQPLRGDVLSEVVRVCERRRDGELPMDVAGIEETFGNEETLLAAVQLRWYSRLSGRIERRLAKQVDDREEAVVRAWAATARKMAGVRAVLDHYRVSPPSDEMARVVARGAAREHELLALSAGLVAERGEEALVVGARLEERARALHAVPVPRGQQNPRALVARLKAVLAA